jgi:hypothetical protein
VLANRLGLQPEARISVIAGCHLIQLKLVTLIVRTLAVGICFQRNLFRQRIRSAPNSAVG